MFNKCEHRGKTSSTRGSLHHLQWWRNGDLELGSWLACQTSCPRSQSREWLSEDCFQFRVLITVLTAFQLCTEELCSWTVVLEKTLESPLDSKEIKSVNPKGNQPWIFIGRRLMLKLKLQYFGHLMWRANSLEKPLILGKIEGERRMGQLTFSSVLATSIYYTCFSAKCNPDTRFVSRII